MTKLKKAIHRLPLSGFNEQYKPAQGPSNNIIIERWSKTIESPIAAKGYFWIIISTTNMQEGRYQVNIGEHLIRIIEKLRKKVSGLTSDRNSFQSEKNFSQEERQQIYNSSILSSWRFLFNHQYFKFHMLQ